MRNDERAFRAQTRKIELSLVGRERSQDHRKPLHDLMNHVEILQGEVGLAAKKGFLRIVFKSITVESGKIKGFELYEPFKSLSLSVPLGSESSGHSLPEELTARRGSVSTLSLSDGRCSETAILSGDFVLVFQALAERL